MLHTNIGVGAAGHLTFAGVDTTELAARFGTPLYLLDEDRVRAPEMIRVDAVGQDPRLFRERERVVP